ncbi:hypothetical protein [Streptomyces rimosus]|uniref:hypothetical protein n=1 Tax=Streptomyces rimosus TaxID=1927 RepID=UPI0004CBA44C|nr:hypothetical protein [Streptomyces rimosus]
MPKPSIGRIVHYRSYGTPGGEHRPACRFAIITETHDDERASLVVFNPNGLYFDRGCPYDEAGQLGGTWHWPERIKES